MNIQKRDNEVNVKQKSHKQLPENKIDMKADLNILNALSAQFIAVILVAGLDNPLYQTRMEKEYNISSSTWNRQKKRLIALGLLEDVQMIEARPPYIVKYPLTKKGRRIAEYLREIYHILKETTPEERVLKSRMELLLEKPVEDKERED